MIQNKIRSFFVAALALTPFVALAQADIDVLIGQVDDTLGLVITALFVIGTVVFLWGVITYIAQADDEAARKKAKALMLWGIIGLAVITAVWGIVNVIIAYFFGSGGVESIPTGVGDI